MKVKIILNTKKDANKVVLLTYCIKNTKKGYLTLVSCEYHHSTKNFRKIESLICLHEIKVMSKWINEGFQ